MDQLAAIEHAVRQSPPRRHDAAAINYEYTENGAFLVPWSPAGIDSQTWHGAAIRADQVREWLNPALNPLFEGLPFGAILRDGRQQRLWDVGVKNPAVQRQERLRSIPYWELGFTPSAGTGGIDSKRILWYGFILLPVVMLVVGAAATRVVRRELELRRMQSDFVAAVSHEFKSPLTGIRLLVERIAGRRYSSPDAADQYCRAIDNEAGRLEGLVSRLLDWQQIEARRKQYRFETSSVAEVARSVVERLRPQAETRGVLIDMKVTGEVADFP
jgi:signal transduction histidine kinase